MSRGETGSTGISLSYGSTSSAFLKAGARLTILSVLSNKVKTQSAVLLSKEKQWEKPKLKITELPSGKDTKPEGAQTVSMITRASRNKFTLANDKDNKGVKMDKESNVNNNNETKLVNGDGCGTGEMTGTAAKTGVIKGQSNTNTRNGSTAKHVKFSDKDNTPFHFMVERKLSEPVLSPRKRANAMTSRMTRCRSTADVRTNEQKPVVRELGGYKYYQKLDEQVTKKPVQSTSSNVYRSAGAPNYVNEIATLRKTVAEQKEMLSQREKHVLQLEKNIASLENENSKSKRQIDALRASVQDCSSTVDYLKRDREVLVAEQDRLKFTLLTYEDELKQLRHANSTLVTEYEHTEQSRLIAVGHLHELEEIEQKAHAPKNDQSVVPDVKMSEQLNHMKECATELRREKTAIQDEHKQIVLLFQKSMQELSTKIREASTKKARETAADATPEVSPDTREAEEKADGGDKQLNDFKDKLKANEKHIDALANEIRNLENKKKCLLNSRFALIQNYQAARRVLGEDLSEVDENESLRDIESGTDEEGEGEEGVGEIPQSPTTSARVTKKIRKLERTLSMDHGVGKMDCIQKLCKKLEDCEQKIAELETSNKDLREENDEMEEETKYLKYVLSYRGDTMKAQLEREYDKKVSDLKEELRVAKETGGDVNQVKELRERNRGLEDEVKRLHEELKSLLSSLPGLQSGNEPSGGNTSQETDELVRNLQEQVEQLTAEKRVLLMSIQARNAEEDQQESECDQSMSKSLTLLEKTLREVENENAQFVETFKRIREVLENEHVEDTAAKENSKIAKLKGEIQRLDDTRGSVDNPAPREDTAGACLHHEERLSELGNEVVRLHEEKKSLLSTIIRLQADPNFTFSDDVTDDDISRSLLRSPGTDPDNVATVKRVERTTSPKLERDCKDKQVQVGVDDVQGIVGYLEDGLGKLKEALGQRCMPGYITDTVTGSQEEKEPMTEVEELRWKLDKSEKENAILQENLSESEAIRSDLHRTISIATEMAQEEREKCANLMQTKTTLEQDMMKLTKDNQDLRDGMETLSRVRKRRNSRVQYMSLASPTSGAEYDGQPQLFLPLGEKRSIQSENDTSDMDVSTPEAKC